DITVATTASHEIGQKLSVALRPEKIGLGAGPEGDADNTLQGHVDEIAYMGNLTVYQVRLTTGRRVRVSQANLTRSAGGPVALHAPVCLQWSAAAGFVLAP
ncbi:hypothetical protein LCGC14_1975590, partial [marine sediment metagenome]